MGSGVMEGNKMFFQRLRLPLKKYVPAQQGTVINGKTTHPDAQTRNLAVIIDIFPWEGRPSAHDVPCVEGLSTWNIRNVTPLVDVAERLSVFKMSSREVHLHMKDHSQVTLVLKCNIEFIKFIK